MRLTDRRRATARTMKDLVPDMKHHLFISALILVIFLPKVCGRTYSESRIVGGAEASPGRWPWHVLIEYRQQDGSLFPCGGSLINKEWILTAAQCIHNKNPSSTDVFLGRVKKTSDQNEVHKSASEFKLHEFFDPKTLKNDIGLLKMDSPVTFNSYIRPVPLAMKGSTFHTGVEAWITGWGRIGEGAIWPSVLLEVSIPFVGLKQCKCHNSNLYIPDKTVCAGVREGGKGPCKGDGGGALVVNNGSVWIQAGIVSFGDGCARPNRPGVYTDVSEFQDWINNTVGTTDPPEFQSFYSPGNDNDENYICNETAGASAATFTTVLCLCLIAFTVW